jgi:uncharacterized membrane protein YhaH (DUF805 family)
MTFGEAIRVCVTRPFTYSGRARRSEFWWFVLFIQLIALVVSVVFVVLFSAALVPVAVSADPNSGPTSDEMLDLGLVLAGIFALQAVISVVLTVPMLAANARRLHDADLSAHWLWFYLAGLGLVPMLMGITEGTPGPNRYGPDPKAAERLAPPAVAPR